METTMGMDAEFDMMFKAVSVESQNYVRGVLRNEFERMRKSSRPRLRLVTTGKILPSLAKGVVDPVSVGGVS